MPIKRDPSLIPLSHDHHHGLVRVFEIRQALKQGDSLARQSEINRAFLRDDLAPHFVAEEQHLFPVLRDAVAEDVVDQLFAEHRELEQLAAAETATDLRRFADLLERHIRREEREVFREYQDHVPAERRVLVGAAIRTSLGR